MVLPVTVVMLADATEVLTDSGDKANRGNGVRTYES